MKLIDSKVELLQQESGLEGAFKQIERCGRTCYKSEDHITEDSYKRFVEGMIKNGHTAMLEHGTIYLKCTRVKSDINPLHKYRDHVELNRYSRCITTYDDLTTTCYVTTNYRVIIQNNLEDDLQYICDPTPLHIKRYTFRITCDRGVSHEIVRHRHMSFAQESTRYCNYSKDKFGNELTFIKPNLEGYEPLFKQIEELYFKLLEQGKTPQEARAILPNALKTEICVTGFMDDWDYFLDLRYRGTTGKPHPDMYKVAKEIHEILEA